MHTQHPGKRVSRTVDVPLARSFVITGSAVTFALRFETKTQVDQQIRSVADLGLGQSGIIAGFTDDELALKLLEMGCLPGEAVTLNYKAPLGDPINIRVLGYNLSIRMKEAASITLEA